MAGALVFGAVCGFIIALLFAPILPTDEKDQIEKAQEKYKEQVEKAQKDKKEQVEKEQKDRKEEMEKQQKERKEKSSYKRNSEQKEKSEPTDKSSSAMASKKGITLCIKNCPDVWRFDHD